MAGMCVIADGKFQPSGISGKVEPVTFPEMPDGPDGTRLPSNFKNLSGPPDQGVQVFLP
jgi:hypothetical protein